MGELSTLLHDALDALLAVSPAALAAALALHVLKIAAEARSWHGIVAHAYRDARFRVTFGAFMTSIAANVVLPAKIGEGLRLGIVRRRVPSSSSSTIAATIVLETLIEMAFSAAIVVVVLLAGRSVGSLGTPFGAVSAAAGDPSAPFVAVGTLVLVTAAVKLLGPRLRRVAADMRRGFAVVGAPAALGRSVLAWKLLAWTFRLATVYFFLVAFHIPATAWTVLLVVAAQVAASLVPLLPGNAGAQQAALVVGLAGYATAASVVALGVGMQAATSVIDLLLGGLAIGLVTSRGESAASWAGSGAAASPRSEQRAPVIEPRVFVLEDDGELRSLLRRGLTEEGFAVETSATAGELLDRLQDEEADALVVDIGLPDADGRDVVQALRARGVGTPVLFLTARDALPDRLAGFAAGGDDYLTKPFAFAEFVARLRALVRRGGADLTLEAGGMRLDPATHAVSSRGETRELTPTEFRILARLAAAPGAAVRRRELIQAAWPHGAIVHDNTLDVYIARLRRKLGELPSAPRITTVHGIGYSLK